MFTPAVDIWTCTELITQMQFQLGRTFLMAHIKSCQTTEMYGPTMPPSLVLNAH